MPDAESYEDGVDDLAHDHRHEADPRDVPDRLEEHVREHHERGDGRPVAAFQADERKRLLEDGAAEYEQQSAVGQLLEKLRKIDQCATVTARERVPDLDVAVPSAVLLAILVVVEAADEDFVRVVRDDRDAGYAQQGEPTTALDDKGHRKDGDSLVRVKNVPERLHVRRLLRFTWHLEVVEGFVFLAVVAMAARVQQEVQLSFPSASHRLGATSTTVR